MSVKTPKGFGRNYFTLSAIQAYSAHTLVQQCEARVHTYSVQKSEECDDESEEELDEVLCAVQPGIPAHAGHCSCYYKRITRNHLLENPQPKFFISTHQFSNSVSSPPIVQPLYHPTKIMTRK